MYWIPEDEIYFPDHAHADENGILALGGDLSPERLVLAYRNGIFPWFNEEDPIIWWSPDPRFILYPKDLKVSKSMRKVLQKEEFQFTFDTAFGAVVQNCQEVKRNKQSGTWITNDMYEAYVKMHELGFAHSVEVWQNGELVGGLYGISFGKCFFGESMFAKVSNASKAGFITFVQNLANLGFDLIDCQTETAHLASLGGGFVSRNEFLKYLASNNKKETWVGKWSF